MSYFDDSKRSAGSSRIPQLAVMKFANWEISIFGYMD